MIPEVLKKIKREKGDSHEEEESAHRILVDYQEFERIEQMIDLIEDHLLGKSPATGHLGRQEGLFLLKRPEKRVGLK